MRRFPVLILAALAACTPAAVQAAPKPGDLPAFVAERDRPAADGRAVLLLLAQNDIETSVDVGRVAADQASGLIDALIISAMDKKKDVMAGNLRSKAYETVRPLHIALAAFDVDALALASTQAALAKPDWFRPQPFAISRDGSPAARTAFIAGAASPQLATVAWRYDLSPDFTQIRVAADLTLARRAAARTATNYYHQRIVSVVQLRKRSYDHAENVALWAADDAALARAALTGAFADIARLIPYALELAPADIAGFSAKGREKAYAAGLYGPLVERANDGSGAVLIWAGGLISIRQTP